MNEVLKKIWDGTDGVIRIPGFGFGLAFSFLERQGWPIGEGWGGFDQCAVGLEEVFRQVRWLPKTGVDDFRRDRPGLSGAFCHEDELGKAAT